MSDKPKKGLKINNANSSVPPIKPDPTAAFSEKAKAAHSKYEEYRERTWALSSKFKSMVEDRTLNENKSSLTKDIEGETLTKLVSLASEMNEDENQPESIGSSALCMLIMKMMLVQRDAINNIAFKFEKLEKEIAKLTNTIK